MIYYGKLFAVMKEQGKNTTHIRTEKIISQDTYLMKVETLIIFYQMESKRKR